MFMPDNSEAAVVKECNMCKSATRLDPESQGQPDDGHASAPNPGSVSQSDAVPSGSPGTGGY